MELIALVIAFASLVISVFFAVKSMQSSARANALSESQKTAALISILSPACEGAEEWKMFINYLSRNNRLPNFSEDDQEFLGRVLNRLEIKAEIVKGRLEAKN
ncbi:MAG: hypothetical protein KTR15_07915 [Phycisphaeraceae bacterium]|nr:hypothetical protein [Phycisphaeraceae bacterium]